MNKVEKKPRWLAMLFFTLVGFSLGWYVGLQDGYERASRDIPKMIEKALLQQTPAGQGG